MHGRIQHGFQYQAPFRRGWPTSYYGPNSGIGIALRYHPLRRQSPTGSQGIRIGVVGLGIGTLASYGQQGDTIRFYEINPEVVRLARQYFTFLQDSPARLEIVQGDARISLEREKQQGEAQQFDVLAVDAFNGDAVPVHLLTRECMQIYRAHLKEDGILALHISCKYFDLSPAARGLAGTFPDFRALFVFSPRNQALGLYNSEWVLLTSNRQFLDTAEVRRAVRPWTEQDLPPQLWTDDRNNLLGLLRRP
jgi:spermidine synthase